jgi:hypothetical protein
MSIKGSVTIYTDGKIEYHPENADLFEASRELVEVVVSNDLALRRVRDLAEYWEGEGFRNYRRHQDAGRRDASYYWLFMYQAGRDILNALDGEQVPNGYEPQIAFIDEVVGGLQPYQEKQLSEMFRTIDGEQ